MVGREITPGQHFKCLCPDTKFLIHALIVRSGEERHSNFKADRFWLRCHGALAKRLTANPVSTPSPLLQHSRIPREIIVNNVTTMSVQIDPFLPHLGADENLWQ